MRTFSQLRPAARAYVSTVVVVGLAAVLQSLYALYRNPVGLEWLALAALTLLTGSFTIKVPSINARLTVSETFVFASVLLFGVAAGTLTVVLETLVVALWTRREVRSSYHAVFNVAASSLSIWLAATVFFAISGFEPFFNRNTPLGALFLPLAALTTIFFLSNSWLVAFAVGLEKNQWPPDIWWKNFKWLAVNYFSGASVAAVLVTYSNTLTARALLGGVIIIVPLLVVCYLTFRTAMGRVEDTNQHLGQLNRLYLSTIETLAMAIDAKDQVTHGHIRRVQAHATTLAKEVGVRDENLLKAIEAAALLHDMGKLAVPEYILNKPGKLTEAEFEKMKLHASVGADILSAIDFPYPVVPIVRHHHENWDGTGYPTGIKGTDIPIGARILAVVDCFDALTSDRPYRPRLSDEDALAILQQRRGTMYDPVIVDSFFKVHASNPKEPERKGPASDVLNTITYSGRAPSIDYSSPSRRALTFYELARALAGQVAVDDVAHVVSQHVQHVVPSALCVLYLYDPRKDDLEAKYAIGVGEAVVKGLRIPLGQRLSGWVAANRQTISNSDAALDLGGIELGLPLKSCMSSSLVADDALVGVLTVYSADSNAFDDEHRRVFEGSLRQISFALKAAKTFDGGLHSRESVSALPFLNHVQQFFDATGTEHVDHRASYSLVLMRVNGLDQAVLKHGRGVRDTVLHHVMRHSSACLRSVDVLFRHGPAEFVALLNETGPEAAAMVAQRIADTVRENPLQLRDGGRIAVDVSVATVTTGGTDVPSLLALINEAQASDLHVPSRRRSSTTSVAARIDS